MSKTIKKGTIVEIIEPAYVYTTYSEMAKFLKAKKFVYGFHPSRKSKGKVVNSDIHLTYKCEGLILLVDLGIREILIGVNGVKIISPVSKEYNIAKFMRGELITK